MAFITAPADTGLPEVPAVTKPVQCERCSRALGHFHRFRFIGMAGLAVAKLLTRLVRVAAIAIRMTAIVRDQQGAVKLVTTITPGYAGAGRHFRRVKMGLVRERPYSKLNELRRKRRELGFVRQGSLVTHNTQLACCGSEIFAVARDTGWMPGKHGSWVVIGPQMTKLAFLLLVLSAIVIKLQVLHRLRFGRIHDLESAI